VAIRKAAKPKSTPAGARPATVMAPMTCGIKVPRSPHAPLHSMRKRRVAVVLEGVAMSFIYQKPARLAHCAPLRDGCRNRRRPGWALGRVVVGIANIGNGSRTAVHLVKILITSASGGCRSPLGTAAKQVRAPRRHHSRPLLASVCPLPTVGSGLAGRGPPLGASKRAAPGWGNISDRRSHRAWPGAPSRFDPIRQPGVSQKKPRHDWPALTPVVLTRKILLSLMSLTLQKIRPARHWTGAYS